MPSGAESPMPMRYDNEEVFAMKKWRNVLLLGAALLLPALALADGPGLRV